MAGADLVRKFSERIGEAIDGLGEEVFAEGISEAVDWGELVQEVMTQDPGIKEKLKSKVAELLGSYIENAENLGDLVGDDSFDWSEHLEGESIEGIISPLFKAGGPLRKKLEEKIAQLIGGDIDNAEDFGGLTGGDFNWFEYLPEGWDIGKIIAELLESDEKLGEKFRGKVRETLLVRIDDLEEDDLPGWSDFLDMVQIKERISEVLGSSDELKEKLTDRLRELIDSKIKEDLDEDAIPEDFLETLDIADEVKRALADHDFRAQLAEKLQEAVRGLIMRAIKDGYFEGKLAEEVRTNPELNSLVERQVGEMMQNARLVSAVSNAISERLARDPTVGQRLMNAFFDKVAESLVAKMTRGF